MSNNGDLWEHFEKVCEVFLYPRLRQFYFNPLGLAKQKMKLHTDVKLDINKTSEIIRYFILNMMRDEDFQEATMRILKYARGRDVLKNIEVEFEQEKVIATFYKEFYEWSIDKMQYVHDIIACEYVRQPLLSLYYGVFDCDCGVALLGSLIACLATMTAIKGMHFRIIVCGNGKFPVHVFLQVAIGEKYVSVDITNKKAFFGWKPTFKNYWVMLDSKENLFNNKKLRLKRIKL